MTFALIVTIWLACGTLTYGISMADHWYSFPTLRSPDKVREHAGFSVLFACLGPVALMVVFFLTGFAQHGLMYRRPKGEAQ